MNAANETAHAKARNANGEGLGELSERAVPAPCGSHGVLAPPLRRAASQPRGSAAAESASRAGNHSHTDIQAVEFSAGVHRMRCSKVMSDGLAGRRFRKRSLAASSAPKWL